MHSIASTIRYLIATITLSSCLCLINAVCFAMEVPIDDFPISPYSQNAHDYLSPDSGEYTKSLLSPEYQNSQLKQFYNHYYATDAQGLSPWSEQMVSAALPLVKQAELNRLNDFNNQTKSNEHQHYAENFKAHDQVWWNRIRQKMNLDALAASEFNEANRAISVTNTMARVLPDMAPDFFHASLPGQGFPFDNLQESAIWAGTPLYVINTSNDQAWSFILTPDGYTAWVKSDDIAVVSPAFVEQWQKAARHHLVAVTQTEAPIVNAQRQFQFTGYIGAVFPMIKRDHQQTTILIPTKKSNHHAGIKRARIDTAASSPMPLAASPQNLVNIINQLKNRPYGWGGAFFFNDCSQEMKSIFTPLGIWLPRNSAKQAQLSSTVDLSNKSVDERIASLEAQGHPLMTLIYIGGHVMLYVGQGHFNNKKVAITYQNIWGLSPQDHSKRYVIGQSLFLPLLKQYPDHPEISSLADKSFFKLIYMDKFTSKADSPQVFTTRFLGEQKNQYLNTRG